METFTSTLEKFESDLWGLHIPVPEDIARLFIEGDNKRVFCTVNGVETIQSALMASKDYWFILLNKPTKNKLGISVGDRLQIQLEKDRSEYGLPMPEEFSVMLEQDEEGKVFFETLTKGKQRSLIYIVGKVKNTDSRINKALAILHHLKEVKGKLDFKMLNETIKIYNQRGKKY